MKCKQLECVYRLDVPHYFDTPDQDLKEFYEYNGMTHMFAHIMCTKCGDEQQLYLPYEYVNQMLNGVLLNEDCISINEEGIAELSTS